MAGDCPAVLVYADAAAGEVLLRHIARPAQQRQDAGVQHLQLEGLDDIIVGAVPEAGDDVRGIAADGEEDDGQILPPAPDPSAEPVPVAVRHVPVQQHQSGQMGLQRRSGPGQGGAEGDAEAFLFQIFRHGSGDVGVVFYIVDVGHSRVPPFSFRVS